MVTVILMLQMPCLWTMTCLISAAVPARSCTSQPSGASDPPRSSASLTIVASIMTGAF